ncbi:MAG: hypothetical protein HYZ53_19290 [Planctomycetes bacterium]|nr:hypothetical protein [Planctomycetota bacterium]
MKRFFALVNLAGHFALHCLRRARHLVGGRPKGLEQFLSNYAADGIRAVTAADEAAQVEAARCVACGACAFPLARAGRVPTNLDLLPGALASTLTRSYPFFGSAGELATVFRAIAPEGYRCPMGVDLASARGLVERYVAAAAAAAAAPVPAAPAAMPTVAPAAPAGEKPSPPPQPPL